MASSSGDSVTRRSVASQFFTQEEGPSIDGMTTSERVVDLLNQAALITNDSKITVLKQVQELIINKDPTLLDNFLDEIIAFQADKSIEVRKFVIGFIEEACKRDIELLLKLIANLNMLLRDENVNVVKKAILTMTQLYKVALQWMVKSRVISDLQEACWDMVSSMAGEIILLLDSDNDGIRTHAIKFVEGLIVTLSPRMADSEVPRRQEHDISLDRIPRDHPYIQALLFIKRMYEKEQLREYVEKFALNYLQLLVHPNPPSVLFGADKDTEVAAPWTEETVKQCLYLYLALLPQNHKLIHELAAVYTEAIADIKRTVLRVIEQPIRGMGMNSPELLLLVENCPKGAETLVTRCLHSLTDKVPPSPELVKRVRDLYHKRLPDVRFLIPVLNGLEKKEVIQALPKLIKLNPIVVKEVFNRLLGTQHGEGNSALSPLNPGELLIALHNIDSVKCDMKSIIKAHTHMCLPGHQVVLGSTGHPSSYLP